MWGMHSEIRLHVPEDMVHLDLHDPQLENRRDEGECGRIVLTSFIKGRIHRHIAFKLRHRRYQ